MIACAGVVGIWQASRRPRACRHKERQPFAWHLVGDGLHGNNSIAGPTKKGGIWQASNGIPGAVCGHDKRRPFMRRMAGYGLHRDDGTIGPMKKRRGIWQTSSDGPGAACEHDERRTFARRTAGDGLLHWDHDIACRMKKPRDHVLP